MRERVPQDYRIEPAVRRSEDAADRDGDRDRADEPTLVSETRKLQRSVGNQAVSELMEGTDIGTQKVRAASSPLLAVQGLFGKKEDKAPEYPKIIKLGKEQIRVTDKKEESEAKKIIKRLSSTYGIKLSSSTTVDAIKEQYALVPGNVKTKLETGTWELPELRAIETAAKVYAPILGVARKKSRKSERAQEVTTFGHVKQAIDRNTAQGQLDTTTLAETFKNKQNVGVFDASRGYSEHYFAYEGDVPSAQTTLDATVMHEMAHAVIQPDHIDDWVKTFPYWDDVVTPSGRLDVEEPPTNYAQSNAAEDLCESAALYFVNPEDFKSKSPGRFAFIDEIVKGWVPDKQKAAAEKIARPKGDKR